MQSLGESSLTGDGSVSSDPFMCSTARSLTTSNAGNTRVISQSALDHFRTALKEQKTDPYSVLLKRNKLPMGLLQDDTKDGGRVCS